MIIPIRNVAGPADAPRIVFLGDSITDNGLYIAYIDAYLRYRHPESSFTLINLGVSSETASGLSEPEHPFPRPCVHDRLARALEQSKPDWVALCYGMNDGIYHPFAEERFQAYQEGMRRAMQAVKQAGAKALVITPPPFDAASKTLETETKAAYSWKAPYVRYNDVLKIYADWIMTLHTEADAVINIYDPLWTELCAAANEGKPSLTSDGIHPNPRGHWIIARTLLTQLFEADLDAVPTYMEDSEPSAWFALTLQRHRLLSSAWKEHVGHTNPNKSQALPLDEAVARCEEWERQIRDLLKSSRDADENLREAR